PAALAANAEAAAILRARGFNRPLATIPQFGVDPTGYPPRPPEADLRGPGAPFHIGCVVRLTEEKGVFVLLEAVAGLTGDWTLTFVGDGPARPALEDGAAALGGKVRFAGQVPSTEVAALLRSFDALLLPSLTRPQWKEQFG